MLMVVTGRWRLGSEIEGVWRAELMNLGLGFVLVLEKEEEKETKWSKEESLHAIIGLFQLANGGFCFLISNLQVLWCLL